jgi:hypothetical protein
MGLDEVDLDKVIMIGTLSSLDTVEAAAPKVGTLWILEQDCD